MEINHLFYSQHKKIKKIIDTIILHMQQGNKNEFLADLMELIVTIKIHSAVEKKHVYPTLKEICIKLIEYIDICTKNVDNIEKDCSKLLEKSKSFNSKTMEDCQNLIDKIYAHMNMEENHIYPNLNSTLLRSIKNKEEFDILNATAS